MEARSAAVEEELVVSRTYAAPKQLVFDAWSTAERLSQWWGPHGFSAPQCVVEFRPQGKLEILMKGHGMEHWMRGRFDEIVRGERIVFTVRVEGLDQDIRTVVTFAEAAGKTTDHDGAPDHPAESADGARPEAGLDGADGEARRASVAFGA